MDPSRMRNLFVQPSIIDPSIAHRHLSAAAADANSEYSCEFGSNKFYAICGFGGLLSCGLTHILVTPLDLVKCRLQTDKERYKNLRHGFKLTYQEGGVKQLFLGITPTAIGYSLQGIGKFGYYEVFKNIFAGILGEENTFLYRTSMFLTAAAFAEFFADIPLSPMEACKVRMQTSPYGTFPTKIVPAMKAIWAEEGIYGFFKSMGPLWGRQIPYTMTKFACFERTIEYLYKNVVPKPRSECTKPEQLAITFVAGYIAGVVCAIVSHPPDTVVSYMNKAKGSTVISAAKALGPMGIWLGLGPRIVMIGTLAALQWFIYDFVKVTFRLPRPPPLEMPESLRIKLAKSQQ